MKIKLREGAVPRLVTTTKSIPKHWQESTEKTLKRLLDDNIIERVPIDEPTDWISPGFFVEKDGGKGLRLFTDFSNLNQWVQRPVHPFPCTQEIIQNIPAGSRVFAKLNATQGYHQIKLDDDSSALTTFLLQFGHFRYIHGPMDLRSMSDEWCGRCLLYTSDAADE